MPRKNISKLVQCRYFKWKLRRRGDVYSADGRSNHPDLGRHSLGTRDSDEALQMLQELDRVKAVELGVADKSDLQPQTHAQLEFQHGWDLYEQHLSRPEVIGGVDAKTVQRYRPICDKFVTHAQSRGIRHWNDVTAQVVTVYLKSLAKDKYADRTLYMEGTFLKTIMKWLAQGKLIPRECLFNLPLKKVRGPRPTAGPKRRSEA